MTERTSFGELLRQHRRAAGLSQEQLAERAGMSKDAVSTLERGTRQTPQRDTVRLLARALELSLEDQTALEAAVPRGKRQGERHAGPRLVAVPRPPTPLIGRDREAAQIATQLTEGNARLLTLLGPGGVGKTRLAIEVAEKAANHFADGVVFVPLGPLREAALVLPTIAHALGLREGHDPGVDLATLLQEKHLLLVLDNFEHVLPAGPVVAAILSTCARLQILTTSRAMLRVGGEHIHDIPPLQTPEPEAALTAEDLDRCPASALLLQRARTMLPNFTVPEASVPAIAAICRRLEGLPLALELAAARLSVLSPALLLQRLERRLPLLTSSDRDLPERQQTLYATLEWSHALLDTGEQQLFRQLSVFTGGCPLEAVEAVAGSAEPAAEPVVDRLAGLIEKSFLRKEPGDEGESRFIMLETVREYGAERLDAAGDIERTRAAHAAFFLGLATEAAPRLTGPEVGTWLERLEREHDNLRAAMSWFESAGDLTAALRLAGALWRFWWIRGHSGEGRARVENLLARDYSDHVAADVLALAHFAAGALAYGQDDYTAALVQWNRALTLCRGCGDSEGIASTLNGIGLVHAERGEYEEARRCLDESIARYRELGHAIRLSAPLTNLANVLRYSGDNAGALALYEEALVADRAGGSGHSEASTLDNLAQVAEETGDYDRAEELGMACLALMDELDDPYGSGHALVTLGCVALNRGDLETATERFERALSLYRSLGTDGLDIYPLQNLGLIALLRGEYDRARELSERALAIGRERGNKRATAYVLHNLGDLALAEGDIEGAATIYGEALQINESLRFPHGIAESCERCARAARRADHLADATTLYARGDAIRARIGSPIPIVEQGMRDRDLAHLRSSLDETAFAAAWQQGLRADIEAVCVPVSHLGVQRQAP